jgi:hypothetical protein
MAADGRVAVALALGLMDVLSATCLTHAALESRRRRWRMWYGFFALLAAAAGIAVAWAWS